MRGAGLPAGPPPRGRGKLRMTWLLLGGAILSEVAATLSLRMASQPGGRRAWLAAVVAGYLAAFAFLTLVLYDGLGIGVAYGVWAASGVALTAIASRVLFKEALTKVMGLGIVLIAAGVLFIELGTAH
ncbi:cation transporter [Actinomadura cremea]|nr:cation transporter [Actinomadura cremea]